MSTDQEIERLIDRALDRDEFHVAYQPQVDLSTGEVIGVEALLRHVSHSPSEIIPVAERTGQIVAIGKWAVDESVRQLARWDAMGLRALHLSVNFSRAELDDSFVSTVLSALIRHDIDPARLSVELTESLVMTTPEALAALQQLQGAGIYVSIDDFGTGYSSLAYLRRLPVEIIKIDQSFVSACNGFIDQPVIDIMMSLAGAMGLHVIAEGVETSNQACDLAAVGCPVAQGFLFGAALGPEMIPAMTRHGFDPSAWCRSHPFGGGRGRHMAQQSIIDELMHQIGVPCPDPNP